CGKKIGPDPRNFNQRVSLGRNDLLIRTFPNILLREAAQRINQLPVLHEGEKCYVLKITCNDEHEDAVRQSVVNMAKELTLSLKAIYSATAQAEGKTEIRAEVMTREEYRKLLDLIMGNMGGNKIIASVSCHAI
ncbi:hypothetical protein L8O25_11360, partial [Enterobacter asburiae]|nr:hypothetical protein [Enterobacter asburiae]